MKRMIFVLLVLPVLVGAVFGEKLASFDSLMKPTGIFLDNRQIYIIENKTIFIYSLQDFQLKKKFGEEG